MTGLFEVALKNVPALQDSVNQHEMASAGMKGPEAQAESLRDNLERMDAGSNAQASTGLGIYAQATLRKENGQVVMGLGMGLGIHAQAALCKGDRQGWQTQAVMGRRRRSCAGGFVLAVMGKRRR